MEWAAPYRRSTGGAESRSATHLRMDGGILVVDDERLDEFYRKYAAALWAGARMHLSERSVGGVRRLFVDIDLYGRTVPTDASIESMCRLASLASADVWPGGGACIVCRAPAVECGAKGTKTGIHLVWENIVVDAAASASFVRALGRYLDDECPADTKPDGGWSSAIDEGAGEQGQLRMLGSRKVAPCTACAVPTATASSAAPPIGRSNVPCAVCGGRRKVDAGRPYTVWAIAIDGTLERVCEPDTPATLESWVRRTAVRVPAGTPITPPSPHPPAWLVVRPVAGLGDGAAATGVGTRRGRVTRRVRAADGDGEDVVDVADPLMCEPAPDAVRARAEAFVRKCAQLCHLHSSYASARALRAIYILPARDILCVGLDSRWCDNAGRVHSSCTTYMMFSREKSTMVQRCYCRCDTSDGRRQGPCRDFHGRPIVAGPRMIRSLFPERPPQT